MMGLSEAFEKLTRLSKCHPQSLINDLVKNEVPIIRFQSKSAIPVYNYPRLEETESLGKDKIEALNRNGMGITSKRGFICTQMDRNFGHRRRIIIYYSKTKQAAIPYPMTNNGCNCSWLLSASFSSDFPGCFMCYALEPLPAELQRNFTLMRVLDSQTQDIVKQIQLDSGEYMNLVNQMNSSEKTDKFRAIHDMFEKAKVLSDEKVQLSMQTYEMVDKHIRRLDSELAKLEADLKDKSLSNASVTPEDVKKKGRGATGNKNKSSFNPKHVIKPDTEKGKKKQKVADPIQPATVASVLGGTVTNEVLDMPVDPNEPTYCLCHQVSYGEMIGCDNPDCPIEWFHFGCVGLTLKPKGKWFCPKCSTERKKK